MSNTSYQILLSLKAFSKTCHQIWNALKSSCDEFLAFMSDECQQETKIFCEFNSFKIQKDYNIIAVVLKGDDDALYQREWKFASQKGRHMQIIAPNFDIFHRAQIKSDSKNVFKQQSYKIFN